MKEVNSIYLVYGQKSNIEGSYYFGLQIFSSEGMLEEDHIVAAYESEVDTWVKQTGENRVGPFRSLESIQKFSFNLCERANSKKIVLLSIDTYNIAVEKCSTIDQLFNEFENVGDVISNLDNRGGKSIFDRIFH